MPYGLEKGYIALRLDPDTRAKLEVLSKVTGWRRADIVSEGVRRFVNQCLDELNEQAQHGGGEISPAARKVLEEFAASRNDEPRSGRKIIV